jgi:HxlR-like helix-turn-helix
MANMETISERFNSKTEVLPESITNDKCEFENYDAFLLMSETLKMRKLITKRGTLEILIPLCCSTNSTRTLSNRLNELEKNRIVERQRYNEIPPRVEYRLTTKGRELAESLVDLLQWMRKWTNAKRAVIPQLQVE